MLLNRPLHRSFKAASSFLLYQAGPVSVLVTSGLVWPLLGRLANREVIGDLSMQLAAANLMAPALSLGLGHYLANRLSFMEGRTALAELRAARIVSTSLYALGALGAGYGLVFGGGVACASVALSSATAIYLLSTGVLRGLNKPSLFAALTLFIQVAALLAFGLISSYGGLALGSASYVLLSAFPMSVTWLHSRTRGAGVPRSDVSFAVVASARLVPHLVLAVAMLLLMRLLVGMQLGSAAAGNYMFASLLIGGSLTIGASLDAHWSARAQSAQGMRDLVGRLTGNQARIQAMLFTVSLAVLVFLIFALDRWLPPGYERNGLILAVALGMPAATLQAAADGRSALLMWEGRTGRISVSTAVGALVTTGLALVLLPLAGWTIAGLCISLGLLARYLTVWTLCSRREGFAAFNALVMASVFMQIVLAAAVTLTLH